MAYCSSFGKLGDKLNLISIIDDGWRKKHIKTIKYNYSKSVNYNFFNYILKDIIDTKWSNLSCLNMKLIKTISDEYFNLDTEFLVQSDMSVNGKGSDLVLNICKNLEQKNI